VTTYHERVRLAKEATQPWFVEEATLARALDASGYVHDLARALDTLAALIDRWDTDDPDPEVTAARNLLVELCGSVAMSQGNSQRRATAAMRAAS
jgi:hypothetical protein